MGWSYSNAIRRGNKLGNKKVERAGYSFGSKLEAAVFDLLKGMEAKGEIALVRTQASVYLTEARILYKPDFECKWIETGKTFFVEAKGFETAVYAIKRRLWMHYGPADLHVYKGSYTRPFLDEIVKGVE